MNLKSRNVVNRIILVTTLLMFAVPAMAQKTQTAKSAKRGAGWGALAGLVFGGSVWDVAGGAALGAAGGAVYGNMKGKEREKQIQSDIAYDESQQRIRLEQERNEILAAQQAAGKVDTSQWAQDRELLNRAFGKDNVDGLFELRDCKRDRAYMHALAGANSDMLSHRLASVWLEALIAVDAKDSKSAERAYQRLIAQDETVVNIQQAQAETMDLLVEIRAARQNQNIVCA
jgi:hypothetical protein